MKTGDLLKLALDYGDRLKDEAVPLTMQGEDIRPKEEKTPHARRGFSKQNNFAFTTPARGGRAMTYVNSSLTYVNGLLTFHFSRCFGG